MFYLLLVVGVYLIRSMSVVDSCRSIVLEDQKNSKANAQISVSGTWEINGGLVTCMKACTILLLAILGVSVRSSMATIVVTGMISVDGDPSDWEGIKPLATDSQDLFDVGAARLAADLKEVYTTFCEDYVYFMVILWGRINLNTQPRVMPEPGEYVTSVYIRIAFPDEKHDVLAWLHPLWGQTWAHVSANRDLSGDFEKESNRLLPLEYAYRNNVLEERIPIDLLRAWGFRSPNTTMLKFYSAAWHPLPIGGYGGVFDSTDPEWLSLAGPITKPQTATIFTVTVATHSIHTTSLYFPVQSPWHSAILFGVMSGLIVASITWVARLVSRKALRQRTQ